jgi:DNA-binding response OmpR family regulator
MQTEASDAAVVGGNEIVLVAEDNIPLMELTKITLESFGYTVIAAVDGEDAIAKFMENKERISLLLLDLIMPKKNGKEVYDVISKICPGAKVIFTSGYTMDIIKTDALTAAGFDFIRKPFKSRDLLLKVRNVLDK